MSPAEEMRRGAEAAQLLANPLLIEAFSFISERIIGEISKVATGKEKAEELRQVLIGLDKFRGYLRQVVATGKMAQLGDESRGFVDRFIDRIRQ